MSSFVHCRGCGQQIHETAPTCPKCGAPQNLVTATVGSTVPTSPSTYAQVPWFRRRWFIVLMMLTFSPVASVIAMTGSVYFDKKGEVQKLPKVATNIVHATSAVWGVQMLMALVGAKGSAGILLCFFVCAAVVGLKNNWRQQ